jgi:hypothetical protein
VFLAVGVTELVKAGTDIGATDFETLVGPFEERFSKIFIFGSVENMVCRDLLDVVGLTLEELSLVVLELVTDVVFVNETLLVEVEPSFLLILVCERSNNCVTEFVGIGGGGGCSLEVAAALFAGDAAAILSLLATSATAVHKTCLTMRLNVTMMFKAIKDDIYIQTYLYSIMIT